MEKTTSKPMTIGKPLPKCPVHAEPLEVYCQNCDKFICLDCMISHSEQKHILMSLSVYAKLLLSLQIKETMTQLKEKEIVSSRETTSEVLKNIGQIALLLDKLVIFFEDTLKKAKKHQSLISLGSSGGVKSFQDQLEILHTAVGLNVEKKYVEGIHANILRYKAIKDAMIMLTQDKEIKLAIAKQEAAGNDVIKSAESLMGAITDLIEKLHFYFSNDPNAINIDGEDWSILLKCADTDLCYESEYWENEELLNAEEGNVHQFTGKSAKFPAYIRENVSELLILAKGGLKVRLKLPERKPLIEFMKDKNPTYLEVLSGAPDPVELACGHKGLQFYGPIWRINSIATRLRMRLGGHFHQQWGQYGSDAKGSPCSAEVAGFGITDMEWTPNVTGKKSFGVRLGHDQAGFGQGQLTSEAIIYGK